MILAFVFVAGVSMPAPEVPPAEVDLTSFELTALAKKGRSEGRAVLAVKNVGTVEIPSAAATCRVRVNGQEVGGGEGERGKIRPKKRMALEIVFKVDHDRFKAAAGPKWVEGASVPAELEGTLTLRYPSGEVAVPLRFEQRMGTDGARSGVFAHPLGR